MALHWLHKRTALAAGLIHLSASALVALIAVCVVCFVWYPAPFHIAVGVMDVFLILLGVDVIIGPLLTMVVYRPGKKSLHFDLMTIAILQLSAFSYGMWTVAEGRPVWLVFNVDRFDLVQRYQVDERKINETKPEYRSPPWWGAQWVAALPPSGLEQKQTVMFEAVFSGVDVPQRPELYLPLRAVADAIRQRSRPIDELARYNALNNVAALHKRWPEADAYLPMMARVKPMTVLINKESAKVITVVDLAPWD